LFRAQVQPLTAGLYAAHKSILRINLNRLICGKGTSSLARFCVVGTPAIRLANNCAILKKEEVIPRHSASQLDGKFLTIIEFNYVCYSTLMSG